MTSTAIAETVAVEHEYEGLPEGTPIWINLAAGAFAGIAEHTLTYPFDSIKVQSCLHLHHYVYIYITDHLDKDANCEAAPGCNLCQHHGCHQESILGRRWSSKVMARGV